MKIVVVGGTGLIGSKVASLLSARRLEVVVASPSTGVNSRTGEGLDAALHGANVVLDVTNAPSFDPGEVMDFFKTSTKNLLAAEKKAGVQHHVLLSIVGTDCLPGNGYFLAKAAQEALIEGSGVPYTIVRATQFMEFMATIADAGATDGEVRLSTANFQPIAADDLAGLLDDAVGKPPANGVVDVAGPEKGRMCDIIGRYLRAIGDSRKVTPDSSAGYFGSALEENSLVPVGKARLGSTGIEQWANSAKAA
ncbi:SDR family oxidoreductase [Agrobacterium tumefaciens]|uniref:NmrA family transcriptional regulator n=1 Tax=Agrobacterium tumefaciens TaxID=358 RepID=A0A176XH87_AGRTU|nr:NmrA family transcriptional regulator [Agrobacterium tumefaciens]